MRNVLRWIARRFSSDTRPVPDSRLVRIVDRQREMKAGTVQGKLSRQARDPSPEQMSKPLYDTSAYGGSD